jgi:hypothetical protein
LPLKPVFLTCSYPDYIIPMGSGYFLSQTFSSTVPHILNLVTLHTYPPVKMEKTECSETLSFKLRTPGNNPKENLRLSKHSEILKSRMPLSVTRCSGIYPHLSLTLSQCFSTFVVAIFRVYVRAVHGRKI